MRNYFLFLLFLFAAFNGKSQNIVVNTMANDGQEVPMQRDTLMHIRVVIAREKNDTAYLGWVMSPMKKKGTLFIYRSSDGSNFSIIGVRNITSVPSEIETAYYFSDEHYGGGTKYYRIIYINSSSEYFAGEKIVIASAINK